MLLAEELADRAFSIGNRPTLTLEFGCVVVSVLKVVVDVAAEAIYGKMVNTAGNK